MKVNSFLAGLILILLLAGCGSLTKMRYSRGFKANIEFNLLEKKGESEKRNISAKAKKQQHKTNAERPSEITISETKPPIVEHPSFISIREKNNTNVFVPKKKPIQKALPAILKFNKILYQTSDDPKPVEPHIKTAGILFLIYWLISLITIFILIGVLLGAIIIDPYVGLVLLFVGGLIASISLIASFVLAIIGLVKISKSRDEYRGTTLALVIILWVLLPIIISLFSLIFP